MWARGMDDFARRASEALRWGVPMGDDVVDGVDGADGAWGERLGERTADPNLASVPKIFILG